MVVSKDTVDIYVRDMMYCQAMLCWQRDDHSGATEWLDKAIGLAEHIDKLYNIGAKGFTEKFTDFLKRLKDAKLAINSAFSGGLREEKLEALKSLEQILRDCGSADDGFIYQMASQYKKSLDGDELEFNDTIDYPSSIPEHKRVTARISPTAEDTDCYYIQISDAAKIRCRISIPSELDLQFAILDGAEKKEVSIDKEIIGGDILLTFKPASKIPYYIIISARKDGRWQPQASYELEVSSE
ncbi:hypothetical protein HY605_00380 [Candidatus Peregrinibacteria bacterium]|nr:hypothetical protein [Candidatus Peregrinibacteria bacterium]